MYRLGIAAIWLYRVTFGALFPTTCKYHPSCSQYAVDALRAKGLVRGGALAGMARSCAAIRGATAASTRLRRGLPDDASPRPPRRDPLTPLEHLARHVLDWLHGTARLHVGVVDRRAHRDRPDAARAADGEADPLDAEPAALCAADEGDPEEVQAGQAEAERRADEVLPGEPDQPGCLVPADARRSCRSSSRLYYALRHFAKHPARPGTSPGCTSSRRSRSRRRRYWGGYVLLVVYVDEPDGVHALHGGDRRQDAALPVHGHADRLRVRDRAFPGRPRSLLGDDEPLDGRPGPDHAAARSEDACADDRQEELADAADERRRKLGQRREGRPGRAEAEAARSTAPPRKVRRKKKAGGRR